MPLVRNEFSLGHSELYRETNKEDPKAVLDGVAVAGIVGILRQLGDLADFAAEVFHGLQEQVMTTASRSHRLMVRVQNIEASLTPLEKALLGQTSHIHFAYTAGCEWHPHMKAARNHFIYNDLPPFIMDSYEECRDPPRINFLDKFDIGGPGSCFKRYSDPTFFKRVSADSDEPYSENNQKARKTHKNKKRRSSQKNRELLRGEQMHSSSGRKQFISPTVNGRTSSSKVACTKDMTLRSGVEDRSNSFDSKDGEGYIECVFHPPSNCMQSGEQDCKEPSPSRLTPKTNNFRSVSTLLDDSISHDSLEKHAASSSSGVTWDEKEEIVESTCQDYNRDKTPERPVEKIESDMHADEAVTITNIDYNDIILDEESNLKSVSSRVQIDEIDSEPDNYTDALNSIESESEIDFDYEMEREVEKVTSHVTHGMIETEVAKATSNSFDNNLSDVVSQTGYTVSLNNERGRDFSEPHASNFGSVCPSDIPYSEGMTRDTVSLNKETFGDLPDSLQEVPPLTSEPYASNLISLSPSYVPDRIEITSDTVPLNKETFKNFPDLQQEISSLKSPSHASNLGSVSPPDVPASKEIMKDIAYSHSTESPICEQVPQTCGNSVVDHSVCTDSFIGSYTVHDMVSAPVETDISSSGSKSSSVVDKEAGRINSNNCKYEETPRESSSDHSVSFWTNGGLLGLQPSKPPDFNISSSLNEGSLITKDEMDRSSPRNSTQKSNDYKEELDLSNEVAEKNLKEPCSSCLKSNHNNDQPCIPAKNTCSSQLRNGIGQTERNTLEENVVTAPGSILPAAPYTKTLTEPNQGGGENSSLVFGLGHRLLKNSFQRKVSFGEKSSPYNAIKSVILEQNEQNGIVKQSPLEATIKEKLGSGYPIDSLPPSPPLEHMKISFQPVGGLEISKLKLKFPDGSNHHGSMRDMFLSFQLVPELSIPLDDSGSHSDGDDTFCRSSHVSDGYLSPRSNNDSDQWESDETPESSDHGVYDSPHGRSSSEYVLSTKDCGGMSGDDTNVASGHSTYTTNGVAPSLSGPLLDFPSFDNMNPIHEKESNEHSECNNVITPHSHAEPTLPAPPPLPPMQWQVSKPQSDITNGMHHFMSEDAEHINDHSLPESTLFCQSKLAKFEQIHINHDDLEFHDNNIHKLKNKHFPQWDQQKLNGNKETNHLRMGKEVDEREDFLQQIRTKSLNLRRTIPGKSNATTSTTASVKVTAILEKVNAIRQVVASDDGEDDDNWSDT